VGLTPPAALGEIEFKLLGVTMAAAILIDATIVRGGRLDAVVTGPPDGVPVLRGVEGSRCPAKWGGEVVMTAPYVLPCAMIEHVGDNPVDVQVAFEVNRGRACRGCAGRRSGCRASEPRTDSTALPWLESSPSEAAEDVKMGV
jgi:hypothetical protein